MLDQIGRATDKIIDRFRDLPPVAPEILLPGALLCILWPMLRVVYDGEIEAFMTAFLLTVALRVAMKAEWVIVTARQRLSPRMTAALVLALGPGLLALLVHQGDPVWCQRFLTGYFIVMAALFILDMADGRGHMSRRRWPEVDRPCLQGMMGQGMVIVYLGLALANELMMRNAGLGEWLLFFGYLPLIMHLVVQSLVRVLKDMASRRANC